MRNNPYAESALTTIEDHVVGWGIEAKPVPKESPFVDLWKAWADSTACDADNRSDFVGLQALVMRTVAESGECLVRRRWRRLEDGFPLPLQLQILEPDFLDTSKDVDGVNGHKTIQGVEFDALGRRVAYWLFREHPGSSRLSTSGSSYRVPATDVLHVFRTTRAGQVRAATLFASVLLRFKDFDEFEDATLMKQKIAACLAVITSDVDGNSAPLGEAADTEDPPTDTLAPGMILNVSPGRTVDVVNPPSVRDYDPYTTNMLRAIATGLGIGFEDLTGNYTNMPFSAARMSRLRFRARVDGWRWKMLVPQFCTPAWGWAVDAAMILKGVELGPRPAVRWTAPPPAMIEPDKEGLAHQRLRRNGLRSSSESIRELGYDPDEVFAEIAAENKTLDDLGIVLDSDPRKMTQAGQAQGSPAAKADVDTAKKKAQSDSSEDDE